MLLYYILKVKYAIIIALLFSLLKGIINKSCTTLNLNSGGFRVKNRK